MFTYTIKDGEITIKGKLSDGKTSASGKTIIVGTTGGFEKTGVVHKGLPVSASINLTIPKKD